MGAPTSLFKGVTGMAKDYPRDRMPEGYVWDLVDYVPTLLDAQLTSRGGWVWAQNPALGWPIEGGIHVPFKAGEKLLIVSGGHVWWVKEDTTVYDAGGGLSPIRQNPVMLGDTVVAFDGVNPPWLINSPGPSSITIAPAATTYAFKYGTVYKGRVAAANYPGEEQRVRWCIGGNPNSWDANSQWPTSLPITGIAGLRSVLLVFHEGSVERFRGDEPPEGTFEGTIFLENLFDRAGCGDARSIAFWQDNCIFSDERGVHLTDGSIVKNMISQGGMLTFWRTLYRNRSSIAACTYLDYYITTVVRTDGVAVTLICDLNKRSWFRFTNIKAICYIQSIGSQERIWAGIEPDHRLTRMAECFFPVIAPDTVMQDANGVPVLPVIETPWYRLGQEGKKRSRFVYTSYDSRVPPGASALGWRTQLGDAEEHLEVSVQALQQMLEVGYLTSPNEPPTPDPYITAGRLPSTDRYRRYRLPIGMQPYGIAFRIRQITPSTVTRVFDFAVEASPEERSRV